MGGERWWIHHHIIVHKIEGGRRRELWVHALRRGLREEVREVERRRGGKRMDMWRREEGCCRRGRKGSFV